MATACMSNTLTSRSEVFLPYFFLPWLNWLNRIINKHCKLRTRQQQILSLYEHFRHLAYCANIIPRSSRIHCNGCHLSTSTLPWNVLLTRWIVLMPSNIVDGKIEKKLTQCSCTNVNGSPFSSYWSWVSMMQYRMHWLHLENVNVTH